MPTRFRSQMFVSCRRYSMRADSKWISRRSRRSPPSLPISKRCRSLRRPGPKCSRTPSDESSSVDILAQPLHGLILIEEQLDEDAAIDGDVFDVLQNRSILLRAEQCGAMVSA